MATRIDTVASREKLKPRREPYWQRVRKGCFVGYRKMTMGGHGAWLARARDEEGCAKQLFKPLGEFGELADHLRFDAATKAAQAWFDHLGRGGTARAATVQDACTRYVRHLRATKSERAAKSGKDRRIKLPDVTAEFFEASAKDKLPTAPLLSHVDGKAWNKDAWKGPIKAAVEAAKLPDGTTAYTLRHSVISDLVHDGLDLLTVAQISGTSVAMIERHYGHLRSDVAAGALARLAL